MSQPQIKVPPLIRAALDESGLPWRVRVGRKHSQLWVAGIFLAVFSHGGRERGPDRCNKNTIAAIRRLSRKIRPEQ
jgi:hypothetical protein